MKFGGYDWQLVGDRRDQFYETQFRRFRACTWPFGPHHQGKVFIEYEHANSFINEVQEHHWVDVGLNISSTRKEAMQRCLDWIVRYEAHGPSTPDEDMERCFTLWPSLYKTRADVLAQWWFCDASDGYDWLDGAIFYGSEDDDELAVGAYWDQRMDELRAIQQRVWDALPEDARKDFPDLKPKEPEPKERPLPDDDQPRDFHLDERARILRIPPDIRPEWRVSAIEAATLLKTRAVDPELRTRGEEILRGLG